MLLRVNLYQSREKEDKKPRKKVKTKHNTRGKKGGLEALEKRKRSESKSTRTKKERA